MRRIPSVNLPWLQSPNHILAPKAVPHAANLLASVRTAHLLQHFIKQRVHFIGVWHVGFHPRPNVDTWRWVLRVGVFIEHVWDDSEVAIGCKLVGDARAC
jgi:hypothetical protein